MKVYQTNGGLGYNQFVYVLLVNHTLSGDSFACLIIGSNFGNNVYDQCTLGDNGTIVELEKYEIELSDKNVEEFTKENYLLNFFVKNFDQVKNVQNEKEFNK